MATFTTGLGFPEGPVWLPDGNLLVVEMTPQTGCITRISSDGKERAQIAKTGRPNGLALDRGGVLWVAETQQRAVLKVADGGNPEVFATQCGEHRFLFLNDLTFGPDGALYVTDSGIEAETIAPGGELNPDYRNLDYDGRIIGVDIRSGQARWVDRGLKFCNGLAFGPDGVLYVNETLTGNIYHYPHGKRELFGNVIERFDANELKGPDGMKFAADGRLFVAVFGQGDITVLNRDGSVDQRLRTEGLYPTNLVFGPPGSQSIYVTEMQTGSVQILDAGVDGLPLHG